MSMMEVVFDDKTPIGLTLEESRGAGEAFAKNPQAQALKKGVQEGDVLTHINGSSIAGRGLDAIADMLRKVGRPVKLTFQRGGRAEQFQSAAEQEALREHLQHQPLDHHMLVEDLNSQNRGFFGMFSCRSKAAVPRKIDTSLPPHRRTQLVMHPHQRVSLYNVNERHAGAGHHHHEHEIKVSDRFNQYMVGDPHVQVLGPPAHGIEKAEVQGWYGAHANRIHEDRLHKKEYSWWEAQDEKARHQREALANKHYEALPERNCGIDPQGLVGLCGGNRRAAPPNTRHYAQATGLQPHDLRYTAPLEAAKKDLEIGQHHLHDAQQLNNPRDIRIAREEVMTAQANLEACLQAQGLGDTAVGEAVHDMSGSVYNAYWSKSTSLAGLSHA